MLTQGMNAIINTNILTALEAPYSLANTQVDLILAKPDSNTAVTITGEIVDAATGKARFLLTPEILSEGGSYRYQLKVTYQDSTIAKSGISAFYVADSLPIA